MFIIILLAHILEFITAFAAITIFIATMLTREAPFRDGFEGRPMRRQKINPILADHRAGPTAWITAGFPAILSVWFLIWQGYEQSALVVAAVATVLGWLNARRLTKSLREPSDEKDEEGISRDK